MDFSYKAVMSVLDDSIKKSIHPLPLPPAFYQKEYSSTSATWQEIWTHSLDPCFTRSQDSIISTNQNAETKLEALKLQQTPGENVKDFTTQFLQLCLDLGQMFSVTFLLC